MPRHYPSALELVGNTPLGRLDRVSRDVPGTILAKLEFMNPGGSNKDRIGLAMIEAAERDGKLKPGGTIVEPTSGNTGVGLAIAAAQKGYRCIFVMPDKMSQEKISMLRGYGAEVVITPTAVDHDSPESYYSVSSRLAEEIPGGFKPDQYSNMANPEAHYKLTAPEIWEQTGGEVDAIVISVGTGGTISGVGKYFKERKPEVLIVGADPEGSIYTARDQSDIHPYLVEGIGKDTWPETMDPDVVDELIPVSDRDTFLVVRDGDGKVDSLADVIGSLQDRDLLDRVFKNPDALHEDVAAAMQPPLAAVEASQSLDEVFATLTGRTNAVVVAREGRPVGVLTRSDLLEYLAHNR